MMNLTRNLKFLYERYTTAKNKRGTIERRWSRLARIVAPELDNFVNQREPGEQNDDEQIDATAGLAWNKGTAGFFSVLCPETERWHDIDILMPDGSEKSDAVKEYCKQLEDMLFQVRYADGSGFSAAMFNHLGSNLLFGPGVTYPCMNTDKDGIDYVPIALEEIYYLEDSHKKVDAVFRRSMMTLRQLYQEFPDTMPEELIKIMEENPEDYRCLIHAVYPNKELPEPIKRGAVGDWKYGSVYFLEEMRSMGDKPLRSEGFNTLPFTVSRYLTFGNDPYGTSPGLMSHSTNRTLQEIVRTNLRQAQKAVDPPTGSPSLTEIDELDMNPGAHNPGAISSNGRPLVVPLTTPSSGIQLGLEYENMYHEKINDFFLVTLFQAQVQNPNQTATEALLRNQERAILLAPCSSRQRSELFSQLITRELDLCTQLGKMPVMPEELAGFSGKLKVTYKSALSRAQGSTEATSVIDLFQIIAQVAQIDPSAVQQFNTQKAIAKVARAYGQDDILNSKEEIAAETEAARAQQQQQSLLENAGGLAQAAAAGQQAGIIPSDPSLQPGV
jgi:hypothetical protein